MIGKRQNKRVAGAQAPLSAAAWAGLLVLVLAMVGSALGVVYSTQVSRQLLNELQGLEVRRNDLQEEWGRLLLEQSSLASQGRIEDKAMNELGLEAPAMDKVVVVHARAN